MVNQIKIIRYYYTDAPDRPGAGAKILNALKAEGINLLAYTAFPTASGRAQIDFVPADEKAFLGAAGNSGIKLTGPKSGFLVQGADRVGAIADIATKLADAHINVTAIIAVSGGRGRYGAILWVKPRNVRRAAQTLGVS